MKSEVIRRLSLDTITIRDDVEPQTNISRDREKSKKTYEDEDDYLVKTIGAFGLWQGVISVTVILTRAIAMWNLMSVPFTSPNSEFVCVEFRDNVTFEVNRSTCYETCLKYNYTSVLGRTIVEDFELICDNAWLASFVQSLMMLGFLLGSSLFGWISDRFSRHLALVISTFLNVVFMVALPFAPNLIAFASIRFVIGVASGGCFLIGVVHILEITGKRYRELMGACCMCLDGIAEIVLAGFAYCTSDWKSFTMSYGIAACGIFVLLLFVPESPRWLVSVGRVDHAVKVVTKGAERNKLDTSNVQAIITKAVEDMKIEDKKQVKPSYLNFVKTKKTFLITLAVFLIWLSLGICYYGIYQYITIIDVDAYLSVVILASIQILLSPVTVLLNKTLGRKISSIGTTIMIGVAMLGLIFVPKGHWLTSLLGGIAFGTTSVAFTISYIHVSELFPTPLRNMSYGLASGAAKIGAMIAPFVANLLPRWLPSLVFCICPFFAGLCCLLLHETRGQNLKDTIEK